MVVTPLSSRLPHGLTAVISLALKQIVQRSAKGNLGARLLF
jgi:hypothetical protein